MQLLDFPQANLLEGTLHQDADKVWCETSTFQFPVQLDHLNGTPVQGRAVKVGVRSQHLLLNPAKNDQFAVCPAQIVLKEDLGGELLIHLQARDTSLVAVVRHSDAPTMAVEDVTVGVNPAALILFGTADGLKIGQGIEN